MKIFPNSHKEKDDKENTLRQKEKLNEKKEDLAKEVKKEERHDKEGSNKQKHTTTLPGNTTKIDKDNNMGENSEQPPNTTTSLKTENTTLEQKFEEILKELGYNEGEDYIKQHGLLNYKIDFAFPELKIGFEPGASEWHATDKRCGDNWYA